MGWTSKSQIRGVLSAHGLWVKFNNRLTYHYKLNSQGRSTLTAKQRIEDALRLVGAEGGPDGFVPPEKPEVVKPSPVRRPKVRLREDIEWVYLRMGWDDKAGDPPEPPTTGASALFEWAEENPAEFFRNVWAKLLPRVEAEKPDVEKLGDDGRPLEGLERMVADKLGVLNAGLSTGHTGESGVPAMASRAGPRVQKVP